MAASDPTTRRSRLSPFDPVSRLNRRNSFGLSAMGPAGSLPVLSPIVDGRLSR